MPTPGAPRPTILGFDTSGPWVSAGLWSADPRASVTEPMAKGQAEHLPRILETLLAETGTDRADLDLIAVGIGPGNFTGIRISVAAARGLALGLGIPAIGVSLFETLLDPIAPLAAPAQLVSLAAPKGQAYVQPFRFGIAQSAPRMIDPTAPPPDLTLPPDMTIRGFRAEAIAAPFGATWTEATPDQVGLAVACMADIRHQTGQLPQDRPAPLYVRAPDAAPPRHPAPKSLA